MILKFGAQYSVGVLDRPTLAIEARTRVTGPVYQALYHAMCRDIDSASKILLKYTALIGEPNLASAVKFLLENVQDQQVREPFTTLSSQFAANAAPRRDQRLIVLVIRCMSHGHYIR